MSRPTAPYSLGEIRDEAPSGDSLDDNSTGVKEGLGGFGLRSYHQKYLQRVALRIHEGLCRTPRQDSKSGSPKGECRFEPDLRYS